MNKHGIRTIGFARRAKFLRNLAIYVCIWAVVALSGCCSPLVRSERFVDAELDASGGCDAACGECDICQCRHVVDHFFLFARTPHALLPGAMRGHHGLVPVESRDAGKVVPHSKFHPVPTRAVFTPRDDGSQAASIESIPVPAPMELELNQSESLPVPIEAAPQAKAPQELPADEAPKA